MKTQYDNDAVPLLNSDEKKTHSLYSPPKFLEHRQIYESEYLRLELRLTATNVFTRRRTRMFIRNRVDKFNQNFVVPIKYSNIQ